MPLLGLIRFRKAVFQRKRSGSAISEIVIHDTDSDITLYESTVSYLSHPTDGRKVSIHYIIGRDYGQILMMVPEENRANHFPPHNDYSIGIELWRNKKQQAYTAWQYSALGQLVYDIIRRRKIARDRIVGHGFFDRSRGGEPKDFEWARLDDELNGLNEKVKDYDKSLAAF
jgi:N-acetyl-anhydromuramyl-L-alanine amidase AmpD